MSTFDPNRLLDIVINCDGSINKEEPFDYEEYMTSVQKEIDALRSLDEYVEGIELQQSIDSLEKLQKILKAIWEDDTEYIDNLEDDEYEIED